MSGAAVFQPTNRQLAILRFVSARTRELGYPPTWRDICDHFGWRSTNAARDHLVALAARGLVSWRAGTKSTLKLTPLGEVWADLRAAVVGPVPVAGGLFFMVEVRP